MNDREMTSHLPEDYIPDMGRRTVPLVVWLKDGHMVDPGMGERHVIGEADIDGTQISITLLARIPDAVMDNLVGGNGGTFSIGFNPEETDVVVDFDSVRDNAQKGFDFRGY